MLKHLLGQLFEKLEKEPNNDKKSKNGNAAYFIEKILEEKFQKFNLISQRGLKDYFDKYVSGKENKAGEPSSELKNIIAQYLGYTNYLDFEKRKGKKTTDRLYRASPKWLSLIGLILIMITTLLYNSFFNNEDCIVWKFDHYEKIKCDGNLPNPLLKDVDILKFRKLEVIDTTSFFVDGHPIVWYGKSEDGELEYFNSRGVHPVTFKELKPITEHIINKYVIKE